MLALQALNYVDLINMGEIWNKVVWTEGDYNQRDVLIGNINGFLNPYGFAIGRGFQPYDPVLRIVGHRGRTYVAVAQDLDLNTVGNAQAFLDFITGVTQLAALPQALQELALITHVCEVGRGYKSSLKTELLPFVQGLANGHGTWADITTDFSPSLTYAQDANLNWA